MRQPSPEQSRLERVLSPALVVVFWTALVCLAAGLGLWAGVPAARLGGRLLTAGLLALLTMPILRLTAIVATAARERDWLLVASTLAVLTILVALTLRDASALR
jgi:hypothetical protein